LTARWQKASIYNKNLDHVKQIIILSNDKVLLCPF